ncbi:MAG: hypothetical protein HY908_35950 [Myxococcales bacterium]|nr:hypothetical protein [Myxococcales bacterium]
MSPAAALAALLAEMEREFRRFRIVDKRGHRLSRALDLALKVVTLGGQRRYFTHYHTVLGDTLYVPPSWHATAPLAKIVTLRHERVHLRQRRRYGLAGMVFLYLVPWLPLGLAWGRARLEWEAYTETLRATWELEGEAAARSPALRARVVAQFTSAAYGWMWPFRRSVERWYDAALEALAREQAARRSPAGGAAGP